MQLPPMVVNNEDPKQTAYTVSVDCALNTTTGISAADRATTLRWLADPRAKVNDFTRPGHVFPLRYKRGGVLARAGHTEASLDLARLAGLQPAGVLCEVVNDDGSMMRSDGLQEFAKRFNLVFTSVQDLIAFRLETEFIDV
jgi:3,4-dihydroxy 2-butanone 4-phosphate synthase/GTP cyclohydrolase II